MQISILIGILFPLILSLAATHQIFEDAFAWEKRQIALDNAAVTLGRHDRDTLQYLSSINRLLKGMEAIHHPLHLCARVPYTAEVCMEEDLALEAEIRELHAAAYPIAAAMWAASLVEATAVMTEAGATFSEVKRNLEIPIHAKTCSACQLETAWEVEEGLTSTDLSARSPMPMAVSVDLEEGKSWDYILKDAVEETR